MISSASLDEGRTRSLKSWSINLCAFSKCKTKLETELRINDRVIDLLNSYCKTNRILDQVNPLTPGHEDGVHPAMQVVFEYVDDKSDSDLESTQGHYRLSEIGTAINTQMNGDLIAHSRAQI